MWFVKVMLLLSLTTVFIQDYKQRLVYFFLYPLIGILALFLHLKEANLQVMEMAFLTNLFFVLLLTGVCALYAKFKLRQKLHDVLGFGDMLFFIFISFSFSTISFITFFVFSLLFSLLLHIVFKGKNENKTVPLAGYMSLFFAVIYLVSFFSESKFLYAY